MKPSANRILFSVLLALFFFTYFIPAQAQTKCDGPADLCAEITELRAAVQKHQEAEKSANDKVIVVTATEAANAKKKEARTQQMIAGAAILAVILKMLLSGLKSWQTYFTTDKGKAWVKFITIGVGLVAFIVTNIGYGVPWWQAIILAGGGPAAVAVHEFSDLIPVIFGKKKLDPSAAPAPDPVV